MSGPDLMQMASSTAEGVASSYTGTHSGSVNVTVTQGYSGEIATIVTTDLNAISVTPKAVASVVSEDDIVAKLAELLSKKNSKPSGGSAQKIFNEDTLANLKQEVLEIDIEQEQNLSLDTDFLEKTNTRNIENEVTTILVENQEEIFLLAEALENGEFNNLRQIVVPKDVIKTIPPVLEAYVVEVGSEIDTEVESQVEDPFNLANMSLSTNPLAATPLATTPLETDYTITSTIRDASNIIEPETSKELVIDSIPSLENAIEDIILNDSKETLVLSEEIADLKPEITKLLDSADVAYEVNELETGEIEISLPNEQVLESIKLEATKTIPTSANTEKISNLNIEPARLSINQLDALVKALDGSKLTMAA